jgi:hypothetical protein
MQDNDALDGAMQCNYHVLPYDTMKKKSDYDFLFSVYFVLNLKNDQF